MSSAQSTGGSPTFSVPILRNAECNPASRLSMWHCYAQTVELTGVAGEQGECSRDSCASKQHAEIPNFELVGYANLY